MPKPPTEMFSQQDAQFAATALFLMTEYVEQRTPMLAAMIAGELLALERRSGSGSPLTAVFARLRHRWWSISATGESV